MKLKKETSLTDKMVKRMSKVVWIVLIVFFGCLLVIGGYFMYTLMPIDNNSNEQITFNLEKGWGVSKAAEELEKNGLIRNDFTFKIYVRISTNKTFLAGTYILDKGMSVDDIVTNLTTGKAILDDSITVTFVEGKRFPYYAQKIADTFGYEYDDIIAVASNEEYLNSLISKYWFIDTQILNKELYYPLEGYIFPDTYSFEKDATIEEIFAKMLDAMGEKLSIYQNEIELSNMSVHGLLTLASVIELEAVTPDDRLLVSGVFYNRLAANDSLGSDVTAQYGVQIDITEQPDKSALSNCNAYNTREECNMNDLPVGPIASPSLSSIVAAITPTKTNYYFFVADTSNRLYFAETNAGHQKNIDDLRKQGIWPDS